MPRQLLRSIAIIFFAFIAQAIAKPTSLADAANNAVAKSKLTVDGITPFHLEAKISEPGEADSDYVGSVELTWISPTNWQRIIKSPDFDETTVHTGDHDAVTSRGDYYPLWLRNLVIALTDPLPMLPELEKINGQLGTMGSTSCARFQGRVGVPPVQNSVFSVYCFTSEGLLQSITTPGYAVAFKNYRNFAGKHVARTVQEYLEPGVTIQAEITELAAVAALIPALDTTAANAIGLQRVTLDEVTARSLAISPMQISWPPVRDGKTAGTLSIYVCVDTEGHVRETYPLNSDNPQLDDEVRKQVSGWQFKRAAVHGTPVQMETILTFAFSTNVANAPAVLTDAEARKLATKAPEPVFPAGAPHGTRVDVRVTVGADGKVRGLENVKQQDWNEIGPINAALHDWQFRPFLRDGKPDMFKADLVFIVP